MTLKVWKQELRLPFLILPLIFVLIGVSMAWKDGFLNPVNAILTIVGVLMLHASVNVLNDYFDYKSGIDIATTPTPFSGGSRILPEKLLTPNISNKLGEINSAYRQYYKERDNVKNEYPVP